jgi:hypothetical protein
MIHAHPARWRRVRNGLDTKVPFDFHVEPKMHGKYKYGQEKRIGDFDHFLPEHRRQRAREAMPKTLYGDYSDESKPRLEFSSVRRSFNVIMRFWLHNCRACSTPSICGVDVMKARRIW